jgi:hypothetical protein
MTSTKPRIIKIDGFWYVLSKPDVEGFWYSLGIGLTPQQAWEEAFPTQFKAKLRAISLAQVERLKNALKVKTTDELVDKARGLFIVNKSVNANIDKK